MTDLSLDFETYSATPIAEAGSFKYMEDPSFRILMVSYAINDGEVVTLDLEKSDEGLDKFLDMIRSPQYVKHAWNCAFERYALQRAYGIYSPPEEWKDTMILSAYCGLPLALGQCSEALLLPQDKAKDKRGKELIRLFSCPNRKGERVMPSEKPEAWAEYLSYNKQDVVAERHIRKMLERWEPPKDEHRIWCLDARINERGIRIDRTLAEQAHLMGERYKAELMDRALEITGLDNPNSVAQVKDWLKEQEGIEVQSLNKKAVADVVAQLQTDKAKEFLEIRAALSKTSIKKYDAMLDRAGEDDHAKGCFQFYGSHTGRWAGRGIQLQNLYRNEMPDLDVARELVRSGDYETVSCLYGNVSSTLSELIRTALIPEEGHKFCVSDYAAIEARVTAYLSDCQWRIDTFARGGDIYCASASQMFKVPVVKHGENGHLRSKGKVAELALG